MSSVDQRVVKMEFDNDTFKRKALETKQSLADVNKAMDNTSKSKGLLDLNSNMQKVSVTASKMAIATTTALATIANKVTNTALQMANSLTFDPIRQGFNEYGELLNKQTVIMNATGKSGARVRQVLKDLNTYSDTTIFSFSDMTEALTSFVNAGIPLNKASKAMQGIANASALAGASTVEAQSSFRAFSQALGQGFLGLQDYRQAAITGKIGTVQFKQELIDTAVALGTLTKRGNEYVTKSGKVLTATKGFDLSLQEQWASAEVLNTALGNYADQNTKLGQKAFKAAQDVRTFSAFMDTLKESLGSGWASIFSGLFGGVKSNIKIWTGLSNAIGEVTHRFFTFAGETLKTWRKMGGLEKTIQTIQNVLAPFGAILRTISKAWNEAFPTSSQGAGKTLYNISAAIEFMTRPLQLLADLIEGTAPVLKTFFQIIRIGGAIVGGAVGYVVDFVGALLGMAEIKAPSSGGLLKFVKDLAAGIADAVDEISDLLGKGKSLTEAFGSVNIKLPSLPSLPAMPKLGNLFGGGGSSEDESRVASLTGGVKSLTKNMLGLQNASDKVDKTAIFKKSGPMAKKGFKQAGDAAREFGSDMVDVGEKAESFGDKIGGVVGNIGDFFKGLAEKFDTTDLVQAFNTAILATMGISLARFFNTFSKGLSGFAQLGDTFNDVLESTGNAITGFAKAQQREATAKLILNLAIAIGILAVSLWVLSKIPADKLVKSLAAMAGVFFLLNRGMDSLTKLFDAMNGNGLTASLNMATITVAIIGLAVGMVLLATAMLIMNKVKFDSILKGIATMWAAMKVLERLGEMDPQSWANMLAAGFAITAIAGAMTILALALLIFAKVKWESMKKAGAALAGITLALAGLVALTKGPWGAAAMAAAGAGFAAAAVGMIALANALILFALVKWESIKKAGVALLGLAVGMTLMLIGAGAGPGLVAAAIGLNVLALALMMFDKVNYSSMFKMVAAMGALALGLIILAPALYLASPALLLFGIAIAALGVGVLAFATAMTIAVGLAAVGTAALGAMAIALVAAIALFLQNLALQAPVMKESILTIIQTGIDTVVEATPMFIDGFNRLIKAVVKELAGPEALEGMRKSGDTWIERLANTIMKNMPDIVDKGVQILTAFMRGLSRNIDKLAAAGTKVVAKFIDGIDGEDLAQAGLGLIKEIITGIGQGARDLVVAAYQAAVLFVRTIADVLESDNGAIGGEVQRATAAFVEIGVQIIAGLVKGLAQGIAKYNPMGVMGNLVGGLVNLARKIPGVSSPAREFIAIGKFMIQGLSIGIQSQAALAISSMAATMTGILATATRYTNLAVQRMDQAAIAAMSKANGLMLAAQKAANIASGTKGKKDDKKANRLQKRADKAQEEADRQEALAQRARDDADRADEYRDASTIDRARMRSEDAQTQFDRAKEAEASAAAALQAANALQAQIKGKANTKAEKQLQKQVEQLRAQAQADAARANAEMALAQQYAGEALSLQTQAGAEAAAAFEKQFRDEAAAAEKQAEFEKLSNTEKAKVRREEAAALKAKSEQDLAAAKQLAYTDLEKANELAQIALDEAQKARDYLKEADQLDNQGSQGVGGSGGTLGTVVDLAPTDAAALAFNEYASRYSEASAAAARTQNIEFNQYNSSPEPLNPTDVWRNTNSQLAFAQEQLAEAAA